MDANTGGALGIVGFLISVGGAIYAAINHKRVRLHCCGKDLSMSVDVEPTESAKVAPEPKPTDQEEEEI
jgi:hypothetical protein